MKMKIDILGGYASLTSKRGKHFSLLINTYDKRGNKKTIWLDPAVKYDDKVDLIIISQDDDDHWKYLPKYLEKYPDTKIYSLGIIAEKLSHLFNIKAINKSFTINGVKFEFFKCAHKPGSVALGLALRTNKSKIAIIPEFKRLGDYEKEIIKNNIWIVGVGNYEKEDPYKISFKELIELANELKPKAIYITNVREDLLKHKKEVESELKQWNGGFLLDSASLSFKSNVYITYDSYIQAIYDTGTRFYISNNPNLPSLSEIPIKQDKSTVGYLTLTPPTQITENEIELLSPLLKIDNLEDFIDMNSDIYAYPIYDMKLEGIDYKIRDFYNYDPEKMTNEQLADDLRLLVAYTAYKLRKQQW